MEKYELLSLHGAVKTVHADHFSGHQQQQRQHLYSWALNKELNMAW